MRILEAARRSWLPIFLLGGGYLFFPGMLPWILACIVGYYGLIMLSGIVVKGSKKRQRQAWIGALEVTDDEVRYSRDGRHQSISWDRVETVSLAESAWGIGEENEWILRAATTRGVVAIPAYPELTSALLEACALRLPAFEASVCERLWRNRGPFLARRGKPQVIQCWRRNTMGTPVNGCSE